MAISAGMAIMSTATAGAMIGAGTERGLYWRFYDDALPSHHGYGCGS